MPRSVGAQRGFTYIGLLMAVVVMGLMLTLVARVWSTTEQRERETQRLWVGHAYRLAIGEYYYRAYNPGIPSRDGFLTRAVREFDAVLRGCTPTPMTARPTGP
jgi:type II secretory pathway pseudopilin PulG